MSRQIYWITPLGVFFVGLIFGSYVLSRLIEPVTVAYILIAIGMLFSLSTAFLWKIFSKLEAPAPPNLSRSRQKRYERRMRTRRKIVLYRWSVSLTCGISAAAVGVVVRFFPDLFSAKLSTGLGTGVSLTAFVLCALSVHEFFKVTDMQRKLGQDLEDRKRKAEYLQNFPTSRTDQADRKFG